MATAQHGSVTLHLRRAAHSGSLPHRSEKGRHRFGQLLPGITSAEPRRFAASIGSLVGIFGMLCSCAFRRLIPTCRVSRLYPEAREAMRDPIGPDADVAQSDDNRRWLAAFYRERAPALSRYLRYRLQGADGEDIVQDAFARLARHRSLAAVQNPDAFLRRIVRNLLIDRTRRAAVRPQLVELDAHEPQVRADQADHIELVQLQAEYRRIVESLPPRTRQVFLLHRVEGRSMKDIAANLDISSRTVEWHVAQAILKIGEALERT